MHTGKPFQWVEFDLVFKGHGAEIKPIEKSFEACPRVDRHFLKSSLKYCESDHDACREPQLSTPKDMRIIDLDSMSIVLAPENCRFCALSYVWGKVVEKWLTLTRENRSSLSNKNALVGAPLPRTVKDAMQLCVELGERYLWVDSLCIVQNDPMFQKQQIDIMDTIYAAAKFTIVAAAGNHANAGLPGISIWHRSTQRQTITIQDIEVSNTIPVMKDTVETSVWNSRGWT
ncbi:HET-domain-containing protein, partial [Cadophora sp. DSE1049]